MARLITCGWETQSTAEGASGPAVTNVSGTVSVSAAQHLPGSAYSLLADSTGTNTICRASWGCFAPVLGRGYYARVSFYLPTGSAPATSSQIFGASGTTSTQISTTSWVGNGWVDVSLNSTRTINLIVGGGTVIGSASAALAFDAWHTLELYFKNVSGGLAADEATLYVTPSGGVRTLVASTTIGTMQNESVALLAFGAGWASIAPGASKTIYFDDFKVNDDTGAAENSYPSDGQLALLVPTGDSAKGTGWTNDANSSTSLFPSVDNLPPAGVADTTTGTGLHQIRNAASSANSAYDATLTDYTTAGVGAGATINLVHPFVNTAAPVTTSAKAGTFGIVSNPAGSIGSLGDGGTAGAFWGGSAGGTYPVGWKVSYGPPVYTPTVTLGTSPVVRINQVTASTRIADVCFLGLYIDYTPGVGGSTYTKSGFARESA